MVDLTARASSMPSNASSEVAITPRQVTAAVIGNALEFYDFTTYAYFAVQIGHAFFPGRNAFESLMLSLATFGAGFFSRPIGAIVIGSLADRAGRKPAMLLSFGLMGLAILGLALTPSYATIGLAAPLLALGFRLLQGFALGGEVGATTAFLIEAAPPSRRGLYGGWQGASQGLASLFGGLIGVGLSHWLSPHDLSAWGWRAAFLVGAAVLPVGLVIRRSLPETRHHVEEANAAQSGYAQPARPFAHHRSGIRPGRQLHHRDLCLPIHDHLRLRNAAHGGRRGLWRDGGQRRGGLIFTLLGGRCRTGSGGGLSYWSRAPCSCWPPIRPSC